MEPAQTSEPCQDAVSDPKEFANTRPSFQRASVLFVTSLGSFIGASLLLASIAPN
ncbi:hypothetical protein [Microvirga ossetica]|uniref:hypothetical protein n=1 Tax=Microvirga ossetica TaxID=1882682 RepID=UPI0012FFD917|nr:hypothetical protein [Microvirga ossetica]